MCISFTWSGSKTWPRYFEAPWIKRQNLLFPPHPSLLHWPVIVSVLGFALTDECGRSDIMLVAERGLLRSCSFWLDSLESPLLLRKDAWAPLLTMNRLGAIRWDQQQSHLVSPQNWGKSYTIVFKSQSYRLVGHTKEYTWHSACSHLGRIVWRKTADCHSGSWT